MIPESRTPIFNIFVNGNKQYANISLCMYVTYIVQDISVILKQILQNYQKILGERSVQSEQVAVWNVSSKSHFKISEISIYL